MTVTKYEFVQNDFSWQFSNTHICYQFSFVSSDGEVRHVLRIRLRRGQIGAYILRTAFLNVRIAEAVLAYEDEYDGQSQ